VPVTIAVPEAEPAVDMNDADIDAAGTMTEAGTATTVLLLESITEAPPEGAAALSMAVQVLELPALTDVGLQLIEERFTGPEEGALTVIVVDWDAPLKDAVMVLLCDVETLPPAAENVAVAAPAATDTLLGTTTAELLLARATVAAPEPAADIVTVQLELPPDEIVVGLQLSMESVGIATGLAETTPPVAVTESLVPAVDDPIALVTPTEALVNAEVVVKETTATTPLGIIFAFVPDARHV
jgi:hypothetical protein